MTKLQPTIQQHIFGPLRSYVSPYVDVCMKRHYILPLFCLSLLNAVLGFGGQRTELNQTLPDVLK